ncbi:hypothetical protein [Pseudodesulfovibrio sp.]|uniref:hypothetical protein n=1 Tax=unclassified Pseudodesulfovibrio TaxID=2661612 RepID=UPI003AFFEDE6
MSDLLKSLFYKKMVVGLEGIAPPLECHSNNQKQGIPMLKQTFQLQKLDQSAI